jgi:hypothetical protein
MLVGSCSSESKQLDKAIETAEETENEQVTDVKDDQAAGGNTSLPDAKTEILERKYFNRSHFIAFEERAAQKVNEFADYLRLMADTSYDLELRENAYGLALDQFEEGSRVSSEDVEMPVHLFLQYVLTSDTSYGDYAITDIQIDTMLTIAKRNGVLTCTIVGLEGGSARCSIRFSLSRTRKLFGKKEQEVWGVYLGNIAPAE